VVPLRDENPIKITPYVTYGLIAANILIFIYELTLAPPQLDGFFHLFAVVPRELTATFHGIPVNQPVPEALTLITSQFLHAGFTHVGFNMLFLWIFGNNIEEELGSAKFLIFYIACGILAALAQWFFSAMSGIPSLGASGAIAGVMGAYILKFPNTRIVTLIPLGFFFTTLRVPAVFFLGFGSCSKPSTALRCWKHPPMSAWKVAALPTGHTLAVLSLELSSVPCWDYFLPTQNPPLTARNLNRFSSG
jgi:membrane associated rhomboid family serine protease